MGYGDCTFGTRQTHKNRNMSVKAHVVVMVPTSSCAGQTLKTRNMGADPYVVVMVPKVLVPGKNWEVFLFKTNPKTMKNMGCYGAHVVVIVAKERSYWC